MACFFQSIYEFMHSTEVRSSQRITWRWKNREKFDALIEEAKAAKLFKEASEDIAKSIRDFDGTEDFEDDADYEERPEY